MKYAHTKKDSYEIVDISDIKYLGSYDNYEITGKYEFKEGMVIFKYPYSAGETEKYEYLINYPNYYIADENNVTDGTINPDFVNPASEKVKEKFYNEFFLTSSGYIRRKVTMSTGETKDFLSDLLPVISLCVQTGQEVTVIAYNEPDFTQDFTTEYMESLQETKAVTSEFIQECFLQLSNDFLV